MNEIVLAAIQISIMLLVSAGIGIGFTRWFWVDKSTQAGMRISELETAASLARRQRDEAQRLLKEEQLKWAKRQQEVDFTIRSLEKERSHAFEEKESQKLKLEEEIKRLKTGLENLKLQTKQLNELHRQEMTKKEIEIKKLMAALTMSEQARQDDIMEIQKKAKENRPQVG